MNRKIIGITVGTTMKPDAMADKMKLVKSVNGTKPDKNGNVEVDVAFGKSAYDLAVENGFEGSESEWLESLKGEPGKDGEPGKTPVKGVDYFDGQPGQPGSDGKPGADGADGFSPSAKVAQTSSGATITITDKSGTTTATVANGKDGKDGSDGYTPVKGVDYFDGQPGKDGADGSPGKDGSNGKDGISPTVAVSKSGAVTTVTITDKDGAKTATIYDGVDGDNGEPGINWCGEWDSLTAYKAGDAVIYKGSAYIANDEAEDGAPNGIEPDNDLFGIWDLLAQKGSDGSPGAAGTSVTVKSVSESTADGGSNVVTFSDGKTVTIKNGSKGSTGSPGANGADGKTPVKGTDYFTSADKAEMVSAVIAALPVYTGEVV